MTVNDVESEKGTFSFIFALENNSYWKESSIVIFNG
jgi:hypothetical protein